MRDDEDGEARNAAGHKNQPQRSARGIPIRDKTAEKITTRHAGEDDADDARPGVERDADIRRHDAACDQFDHEGAGAADEGEEARYPHGWSLASYRLDATSAKALKP